MSTYGKGDSTRFVHNRFGMFIHWGLYSLAARHEWVKNYERMTDEQYQSYFDHYFPDLYDPREWARLARKAGMTYFVITAKHHEGFCLWDSKHTDYKATKTAYGQDVLRPMIDAFREEGLRVGLYYSLIDWHHPEFPVDRFHPQRDDAAFREAHKNRDVRKYAEYMRRQVEELLTQFGEIDIAWFDFSYPGPDGKGHADWESEKLVALVRKLQPNILIDDRLDLEGSGDFVSPEQYQPEIGMVDAGGKPVVWEACQTFSGSWGYHRDELTWKSVDQLLRLLIDGVSKGGNLLLNVGPTARGEIDYRARARLEGMGEWMRAHSRSIYGCGSAPAPLVAPPDCRYTYNAETNRLYVHIFAWPFRAIHLQGLAKRVAYAQFLHDGSEVRFREAESVVDANLNARTRAGSLTLDLPVVAPATAVPVIELFLR